MSEEIGSQLPPPLRFELGAHPSEGVPKAALLVTVDADGSSRVAVLGAPELRVRDAKLLEFEVHAGSTTCENLRRSCKAALWYVLDAAAYSIRGEVSEAKAPGGRAGTGGREFARFELAIRSVLRDFRADAPMLSGPTYKRM
jgi:hypothetical protein